MSDVRLSFTWRQWMESKTLHPILQEVLLDVLSIWPAEDENRTAECTCIRRTTAEEVAAGGKSGIHVQPPPFRAIDLRNKDWGPGFQARADQLGAEINKRWAYDPARQHLKVAITAQHGSGPHIHLQVCAGTRRRA